MRFPMTLRQMFGGAFTRGSLALMIVGPTLCAADASAQTTALVIQSPPDDPVGQGTSQTWTTTDVAFSAYATFSPKGGINSVTIAAYGPVIWTVKFLGAVNGPCTEFHCSEVNLRLGDVHGANGIQLGNDGPAGDYRIVVDGLGTCPVNGRTGDWRIYEMTVTAEGTVVSFAADFDQWCADGSGGFTSPLFGAVRYNASRSTLQPALEIGTRVTALAAVTPLPARVGIPTTWVASGTPGGIISFRFLLYSEATDTWKDLLPGLVSPTGTATWTPGASDVGHHILRVQVREGNGYYDPDPIASQDMSFDVVRPPDIVWANSSSGQLARWGMGGGPHGEAMIDASSLTGPVLPAGWHVVGTGDVDGDGHADLFLQSDDGHLGVWFFNGSDFRFGMQLTPNQVSDTNWQIRAVGDFNHDGHPDLVWQYVPTGQLAFWLLDGTTVMNYVIPAAPVPGADWVIVGAGDSNGDGEPDLFWQQQSTGALAVWRMHGTAFDTGANLSASPGSSWHVVAVADLDDDGSPELVLQNGVTGQVAAWYFADTTLRFGALLSPSSAGAPGWNVVGSR